MTTTTYTYAETTEAYRTALDLIDRYANDRGKETFAYLAAEGRLRLVIDRWPDNTVTGHFTDSEALPCWDGCDSVLTFHRSGWCRTNPEHADRDCNCDGGHDEPEDYDWPPGARVVCKNTVMGLEDWDRDGDVIPAEDEEAAEYLADVEPLDEDDEPDWESIAERRAEARFDEAAWDRYHERASSWDSRFPI